MNLQQSGRSDCHYYEGGEKLTLEAQGKHN